MWRRERNENKKVGMAATYRERRGWLGPAPAFNADLSTQINRVSRERPEETCVKRDKGPLFVRKAVHCDLTKLTFAYCKAR